MSMQDDAAEWLKHVDKTLEELGWLPDEAAETTGCIRDALSAAGYVVVPREPTREMLNACKGAVRSHNQSLRKAGILEKGEFISHESSPAILYRAMLSAAQEPQP